MSATGRPASTGWDGRPHAGRAAYADGMTERSTDPDTQTLDIAVIGGDGIGPEVVAEGLKVLEAVTASAGPKVSTTEYDLGARRWHATGETLPDSVLAEVSQHDAILLGAIGDPTVPSGVLERGVLLPLRFALEHYVNLRPARLYPASRARSRWSGSRRTASTSSWSARAPRAPTSATAARSAPAPRNEIATEVSVNTRFGVERVVRDAFARAPARPRRHLTLVHKHNVLTHAGHLWRRTVEEVATDFPEVETAYQHVDAATIFLTTDPGRFDVIVTDNLFGDIITDIAAAIAGGIGLAASGNINPEGRYPSMFEPVHGSAPDIAGQEQADPTATILSVSMLLAHLGRTDEAAPGRAGRGRRPRRTGHGRASTSAVGDAIASRL